MEMTQPLVWWINQDACSKIGPAREEWPAYLKRQYEARLGRAGRCRLWVDDETHKMFGQEISVPWPDSLQQPSLWNRANTLEKGDYGGIVIHPEDVIHLMKLPGIITDLKLRTEEDEDTLVIL